MAQHIAKQILAQLMLQTRQFHQALDGITEEESIKVALPGLNPVKWVAGHLLNTRLLVLAVLTGQENDPAFARMFGKGSTGSVDASYPAMKEIMERWEATAGKLSVLTELSDEFLLSKPKFQTSIPDETTLGFVAYMASHESMHLGQISVLRKLVK